MRCPARRAGAGARGSVCGWNWGGCVQAGVRSAWGRWRKCARAARAGRGGGGGDGGGGVARECVCASVRGREGACACGCAEVRARLHKK